MNAALIIYLIGCLVALCLMLPDFIRACKFKHDFKTVCVYVLKLILFVVLSWLTPTIIAIEEFFYL